MGFSLARVTCEASQVLLAGGQVVFLGDLPFSPHLPIDPAQHEWNNIEKKLLQSTKWLIPLIPLSQTSLHLPAFRQKELTLITKYFEVPVVVKPVPYVFHVSQKWKYPSVEHTIMFCTLYVESNIPLFIFVANCLANCASRTNITHLSNNAAPERSLTHNLSRFFSAFCNAW